MFCGNWSTWTGDVPVDAQENFFITSASPTTALGGPRATVEMYKFYYGYPRRASVNLQPGDVLAGTARLPEGLLVFDIKKLADERAKPPALHQAIAIVGAAKEAVLLHRRLPTSINPRKKFRVYLCRVNWLSA